MNNSDLISRESVDGRGLAFLIHADGSPYTDYERGYNDAVISYYSMVQNAPAVEAEPIVHARWEVVRGVLTPGGDPLLRCPRCKSRESEHLGGIECNRTHWICCPICGAHMDEEVSE